MTSTVEIVLSPPLQIFLVIRCTCKETPLKMTEKASEKSVREKIDEFLHEKNYFTNGLELIEKNTGVDRLYICLGKLSFWPKLAALLHTVKHEPAKTAYVEPVMSFLNFYVCCISALIFTVNFRGVASRSNRLILCFFREIDMAPNCFFHSLFFAINCSFFASYCPWL